MTSEVAPARILVTGSRDWDDTARIDAELDAAVERLGREVGLVSGACPKGADHLAELWAARRQIPIERHPADWARHGRRAGFVRNAVMVEAGADVCIAFIRNGSAGASMTARLAALAGIPVVRVEC